MSTNGIDEAKAIRTGEALDVAALQQYLHTQLPHTQGLSLNVLQFPSGYSNLTYLLQMGNAEWVLRRPPHGAQVKAGHDMAREYRVLQAIYPHYPLVPQPILLCADSSVLGAPFYVMQRLRGVILRAQLPKQVQVSATDFARLSDAAIRNLARIHQLPVQPDGLGALGNPSGYVQRQVQGWIARYEKAKTDEVETINTLLPWLVAQMPAEAGACLVHNDYKYDNLVLDAEDLGRIVGVLDWEMATIGCPYMDLGTTLGYWMEAGDPELLRLFGPTALPGNYTREQVLHTYAQASGQAVVNPVYYYAFGCFKICVIAQQIYYRYRQGHTQDPRFAVLNQVAALAAQQACQAIDRGRISW